MIAGFIDVDEHEDLDENVVQFLDVDDDRFRAGAAHQLGMLTTMESSP